MRDGLGTASDLAVSAILPTGVRGNDATILVISGLMRSGTSALARIAHQLGVRMGKTFAVPKAADLAASGLPQ